MTPTPAPAPRSRTKLVRAILRLSATHTTVMLVPYTPDEGDVLGSTLLEVIWSHTFENTTTLGELHLALASAAQASSSKVRWPLVFVSNQ